MTQWRPRQQSSCCTSIVALLVCFAGHGALAADTLPVTLLGAVRSAVANNVSVRVQEQQIRLAQGALEQASSQFDPIINGRVGQARDKTPTNSLQREQSQRSDTSLDSDVTTIALGASQQYRNGAVIGSTLSTTRSVDTVNKLSGLPPLNVGRLDFTLLLPLGRGSGLAVAAPEIASSRELQAVRADLQQTLAQQAYSTTAAYWALVASRKNLEIARKAESGMAELRGELQKLIAADERPAAELTLVMASAAEKATQRVAAEQAVHDAQQSLGRLMGISYPQYEELLPVDDFPPRPGNLAALAHSQTARLVADARRGRQDLAAAQYRREAAQTLADAAQQNLKPQVDLKFNLGYAALNEGRGVTGTVWPYSGNVVGPNAGATLSYQWPVHNRGAQGALAQQLALLNQSDIRLATLANDIGAGVVLAMQGARTSIQQLQESRRSLELYGQALENEKVKNRLGQSTLVEVLGVNNQLLSALAADVAYQANYLTFIARLRLESATLLESTANELSITPERLITPPASAAP
jgi:outer membrane protein TolC